MALVLAGDVISSALRAAGIVGVGQTANPQDTSDGLDLMNTLLTTWQINRWLTQDLVIVSLASTGATNYTVGPASSFVTAAPRPDKLDSVYATLISTGADTFLYPYMSREGYNRYPNKSTVGLPERFFYDPSAGTTGTIYFAPVLSNLYTLNITLKVSLGQLASVATTINLPQPYIVALLWNLAAALRPYFQLPEDPQVTRRAEGSLFAMVNSIAQVPNAVAPLPSPRAGVFSALTPPKAAA